MNRGLNSAMTEAFEAPPEEFCEIALGYEERLATEEAKRPPLRINRGLHKVHVVGPCLVPGVAFGVLIAVLALYVAPDAKRADFDAHRSGVPRVHVFHTSSRFTLWWLVLKRSSLTLEDVFYRGLRPRTPEPRVGNPDVAWRAV
jgi:hypothetical protein